MQEEKGALRIQSSSPELEESLGQHNPLEDSVFKVAENAQPARGNQEAAAGSKEKENQGSVHTKEVFN